MSRLGQVSLTKPTYRRIVLRCCSVPQAKPSPDYEYRISLRPHPVGHPSSSTRDSASRAVPSSIRVRRDGYREAGEWQQAGGDQRDRAAQKVFARAGSRKPRSDQHQECSTTDNHGYRRLACRRPIKQRRTTHGYRVNLGPAGGELQDFRPDFSRPLLSRPCGFIDSSQPAIFATSARCPKTEEPERRSPASWDRTGTGFGGERRLDSAGDLWWVASEGFFSSISLAVGRIISACRPSPTL
jgi:hypothetical protein